MNDEIITANELDWLMNGCLMGMLFGVLLAALLISEVL